MELEYNTAVHLYQLNRLSLFLPVHFFPIKHQFMVEIANRQNSSVKATGYLIVKIEDSSSSLIALA